MSMQNGSNVGICIYGILIFTFVKEIQSIMFPQLVCTEKPCNAIMAMSACTCEDPVPHKCLLGP